MKRYLLYTDQQMKDYSLKHRDFISRRAAAYARWVNSLPFWEWVSLVLPPGHEEEIIGILCFLHIRGYIHLTFNETCTAIQRNPLNSQEYEEAVAKTIRK